MLQMRENCWPFARILDSHLLMHAFPAEDDFDIAFANPKQRRQESHHMVRRPPVTRLRRNTHLKLSALGLAYGILASARFTQDVDNQGIPVPSKKAFLVRASHASIISPCQTAFFW